MKLRIDKYDVDSNIDNVSFDYSLKDYKQYGKRNATYSKAIKITRSAITDRVFQGIGNVSQINGFNMGKKYYAEIHDDGITVLRGYIKIEEVNQDAISAVFYSNNISVISTIGDKLIAGNANPSDDVVFPEALYQHTETDTLIKQWLANKDFTPNGKGYLYPYIDYIGDIKSRADIEFADFILPAVGAYQIFDKIMEQEGFTYELSPLLDFYLKQLYIPHNDGIKETINPWDAVKVRLGNSYKLRNVLWNDPSGITTEPIDYVPESAVIKGFKKDPSSFDKYSSSLSWWGDENDQNYIPIIANGVYDVSLSVVTGVEPARDFNSIHEDSTVTYVLSIVNEGTCVDYVFGDVSVCKLRNTLIPDPSFPYSFDSDLAIWKNTLGLYSYYDARDTRWDQFALKGLNIKKGSKLFFRVTPDGSSNYTFDSSTSTWTYAGASRYPTILPRYESSTNITITKTDTALGSEWNLNSMLPRNWKQKDFVNDIFKMFNVYVTTDPLNERHLIIKTYDEFFENPKISDWSNKINDEKTIYKLLKNDLPKSTKYLFKTDNDIYSKNHEELVGGPMYFGIENNDSEFATEEEELSLSSGSTPMKSIYNASAANVISDSSLMEIPVLINDKEAKTDWNPRFLFPIKIYDTDSSNWMWTLAPYQSLTPSDSSNMFIGWTSSNTYLNKSTETNKNLYNLFYRRERNELMDDNTFSFETEAILNTNDIANLEFSDKIWIASSVYGNAFYRVNDIKNYKKNYPCKVKLIKINYTDNSFDNTIATNKINLSTLTAANINTSGKINTNVSVEDSSIYDPIDPTTIINNYYFESSTNYNVDSSITELYEIIDDISVGNGNVWNALTTTDNSIGLGGALNIDTSIETGWGHTFEIWNSESYRTSYLKFGPYSNIEMGTEGGAARFYVANGEEVAMVANGYIAGNKTSGFGYAGRHKFVTDYSTYMDADDRHIVDAGWVKTKLADVSGGIGVSKTYVDGSLAIRDSSIIELYEFIDDLSIGDSGVSQTYVDGSLATRDSSIIYLYDFVGDLSLYTYSHTHSQDASIVDLYSTKMEIDDAYDKATIDSFKFIKEVSINESMFKWSSGLLEPSVNASAYGSTGYIQVRSATGTLYGESELFWDITNNRLGVGTSTPGAGYKMDVFGSAKISNLYTGSVSSISRAANLWAYGNSLQFGLSDASICFCHFNSYNTNRGPHLNINGIDITFSDDASAGSVMIKGGDASAGGYIARAGNVYLEGGLATDGATKYHGKIKVESLMRAPRYAGAPTEFELEGGDIYYDTNTNKLRCYNGTTWTDLF